MEVVWKGGVGDKIQESVTINPSKVHKCPLRTIVEIIFPKNDNMKTERRVTSANNYGRKVEKVVLEVLKKKGFEVQHPIKYPATPQATVKGFADAVKFDGKKALVIEVKTAPYMPLEPERDHVMQVSLYTIGLEYRGFEAKPFIVYIVNTAYQDFQGLRGEVEKVIEGILDGDLTTTYRAGAFGVETDYSVLDYIEYVSGFIVRARGVHRSSQEFEDLAIEVMAEKKYVPSIEECLECPLLNSCPFGKKVLMNEGNRLVELLRDTFQKIHKLASLLKSGNLPAGSRLRALALSLSRRRTSVFTAALSGLVSRDVTDELSKEVLTMMSTKPKAGLSVQEFSLVTIGDLDRVSLGYPRRAEEVKDYLRMIFPPNRLVSNGSYIVFENTYEYYIIDPDAKLRGAIRYAYERGFDVYVVYYNQKYGQFTFIGKVAPLKGVEDMKYIPLTTAGGFHEVRRFVNDELWRGAWASLAPEVPRRVALVRLYYDPDPALPELLRTPLNAETSRRGFFVVNGFSHESLRVALKYLERNRIDRNTYRSARPLFEEAFRSLFEAGKRREDFIRRSGYFM
ncbi:hypothetical protein [Pyrococcus kukulkanii]|uniref:Uncharacterized protein n=1 Tax=Pyrococcus kukulkanii TaxID=1609559 RepID=A0ABV4T8D0_9EURY